ncbi:class D sortase [Fictibacillus aquaticus]|uniref:Class D sortase n=1 Tax=Fictibacillus aquaticus TaxID=2021314 RepID=A0A235F8F4_9BACL|nr:class D sortase [Fictibacillus aquaticus]OYD57548.1 hypothetical protein CGZ90_12825 [Fictibacillus aquaticus]
MKWIAYLLIAAGILTMSYPKLKAAYTTHQEKELVSEWEAAKKSYSSLDTVFASESAAAASEKPADPPPKNGSLLGKISIPRIEVELPVVEGASQKNLKNAAGHLEGTAPLGGAGNAALAAHRSYTYGKQFNRLNEMKKHDEIMVETADGEFTYKVFSITIVEPDDTSVLKQKEGENILTLITCEPMKNPTHRLIVQAKKQ